MATNTSHWLKVQSMWFKSYIFAKQCYFDQLLNFQILLLLFLHTLLMCHILCSLDAGFLNTIGVSNSLDPDQARHFVRCDIPPLTLCMLKIFSCCCCRQLTFFQNQLFQKILLGTLAQSYSLDLDQDRQNVGPDLGPKFLQRLSVDDKSQS